MVPPRLFLAAALIVCAPPLLRADVLTAGNSVFEGTVSEEPDGTVKIQAGRKSLRFGKDQVTRIEKAPLMRDGTRRFQFSVAWAYYLQGELEYMVTFRREPADGDFNWNPWLKGFVNVSNDTDRPVHLYVAVALFDKQGNLLGAASHPWWEESIVEAKATNVINLDFGLAGYAPEDIDYFSITLRDSYGPQLPAASSGKAGRLGGTEPGG